MGERRDVLFRRRLQRDIKMKKTAIFLIVAFVGMILTGGLFASDSQVQGFSDAAAFGFSPNASGMENSAALQKALDRKGTVIVSQPGIYKMGKTVYIGSNTSLLFGNDIKLKKVDEKGPFSHVLVNKGSMTKTYDENIVVQGLEIIVNEMDIRTFQEAYGLHGQLAFFYVKDLRIDRFRCYDLGKMQYGIHICTFEDVIVNDVIIKGKKDGVHFGRGKRFRISNGVFETFDDAIALNAHDYAVGNPEYGWIEDGIVENCHDLNAPKTTGYFCRILAGAWIDWQEGMEVQQSDVVVSNGRLYRVQMQPNGAKYKSVTRPSHEKGTQTLDGIVWGVVQDDVTYTAGVRNVVFRDIFLRKPRTGFSIHFDNDRYSRSYYPGAKIPQQEQLVFDNVRVLHGGGSPFISVNTPMDVVSISRCSLGTSGINFTGNGAMKDYLKTKINMAGCVFNKEGEMNLIKNGVPGKLIELKISSSTIMKDNFFPVLQPGKGEIKVISSDLNLK